MPLSVPGALTTTDNSRFRATAKPCQKVSVLQELFMISCIIYPDIEHQLFWGAGLPKLGLLNSQHIWQFAGSGLGPLEEQGILARVTALPSW